MRFEGYLRANGTVGVRNHVLVMASVSCANSVVDAIGREFRSVKTVTHTEGCGRAGEDVRTAERTLVGLGSHPNVASVLVVGLGCEVMKASRVAGKIRESKKRVEDIDIQDCGGSRKATARGIEIVGKMLAEAKGFKRKDFGVERLIVGHECGGSDGLSGVTANPVVGVVSDKIVGAGGTVIFSETTEMFGTENLLARKAATPEVAEAVVALIARQRAEAIAVMGEGAATAISPGNRDGGLTTIQEKSLGCVIKAGTTPIREVLDYAQAPSKKGVVVMDTPGSDIFSITGMAAAGAQIMTFTTGRGSPAGFSIVPVIKIASNNRMFESMNDDMDINAGKVVDGVPIGDVGDELLDFVCEVASGRKTCAEVNRQEMLAIYSAGKPF